MYRRAKRCRGAEQRPFMLRYLSTNGVNRIFEMASNMTIRQEHMATSDQIKYSVVEGWEQLPKGWAHRDVAGVAVDQEDRVFLICRGDHPVIIYDSQGNFKRSWGEGMFSHRTHGIYIAPTGTIFATDDGNHTVRQFTPEGKLSMTMGVLNTPSDTGYDGKTVVS